MNKEKETKMIGVMCHLGGINNFKVNKEDLIKDPIKTLENLLSKITEEPLIRLGHKMNKEENKEE
jgi:hypothetical protein|tara:strand:+ start:3249 stop:3443 length:195 start_codon:yes stop_codon:yes gene_type:complete